MKKTLDERFTDLSDIVSEQGGRWPTTLAAARRLYINDGSGWLAF